MLNNLPRLLTQKAFPKTWPGVFKPVWKGWEVYEIKGWSKKWVG